MPTAVSNRAVVAPTARCSGRTRSGRSGGCDYTITPRIRRDEISPGYQTAATVRKKLEPEGLPFSALRGRRCARPRSGCWNGWLSAFFERVRCSGGVAELAEQLADADALAADLGVSGSEGLPGVQRPLLSGHLRLGIRNPPQRHWLASSGPATPGLDPVGDPPGKRRAEQPR